MSDGGNVVPRITKAEHIGPSDTGDNIEAKRVANYTWNPITAGWERAGNGLVPATFDYISIPSYDVNNNPLTVIYKTGGASGTTVCTLTITYSGSNIATVTRS